MLSCLTFVQADWKKQLRPFLLRTNTVTALANIVQNDNQVRDKECIGGRFVFCDSSLNQLPILLA
jgi:hypothetical protein